MKVLLALSDLYKSIGGGQTVYRKIVEASPDVEFFYLLDQEKADAVRPRNAHGIPLAKVRELDISAPPPHPISRLAALREADQIARSVAGQQFDIVDFPDFRTCGSMMNAAFAHNNVGVRRFVLAMHGNISHSISLNWGADPDSALEHRVLEREQFEQADAVYSISLAYMRQWEKLVSRNIHYIDPIHFVDAEIAQCSDPLSKPSLYCIGRSERLKGNDLFIELVRWLDPASFEKAVHVGGRAYTSEGTDSAYILQNIASVRGIRVDHLDPIGRAARAKIFSRSSVVVLPVRHDSLNLVALEALFSGCLVAVSSRAGVCEYLDMKHPGIPYLKLDLDNFYRAAADLQALVRNFECHRRSLRSALASRFPEPETPLDMTALYKSVLDAAPSSRQTIVSTAVDYADGSPSMRAQTAYFMKRVMPSSAYARLRYWVKNPVGAVLQYVKSFGWLSEAKVVSAFLESRNVLSGLRRIGHIREENAVALRKKREEIYSLAKSPLYRCNYWLDIARIERLLGNDLMAVTYELRALRLVGNDRMGLLPRVIETLQRNGFPHEAEAAEAMYADSAKSEARVFALLNAAYIRNRDPHDKEFEIIDDRRSVASRVSVIVSLYNAADKLCVFLTALCRQTVMNNDNIELILVDSGSPSNEYEVIKKFLATAQLNVVYARSRERETIQAAWNRGIGLARAPYLVFLGVDEVLYPEALEVLARELDDSPSVDWVMSNSLVTAVNEHGLYEKDIMPYDRRGAVKDHTYLDTCYTTYVGGMYRKSVHDRFGYYDETFGAAGDTEFKLRVLPHIAVKFIDRMLGIFLNYPDGQTTASPKAEIEDLRAWYMHRTPGGVRYAFESRSMKEAEELLCISLGYRKSYYNYSSCDIEYAKNLAQYIISRQQHSTVAEAVFPGLEQMLRQLMGLEFCDRVPTVTASAFAVVDAWRSAVRYEREHRAVLGSAASPSYKVLNDNRFEQHSWLWKSK